MLMSPSQRTGREMVKRKTDQEPNDSRISDPRRSLSVRSVKTTDATSARRCAVLCAEDWVAPRVENAKSVGRTLRHALYAALGLAVCASSVVSGESERLFTERMATSQWQEPKMTFVQTQKDRRRSGRVPKP